MSIARWQKTPLRLLTLALAWAAIAVPSGKAADGGHDIGKGDLTISGLSAWFDPGRSEPVPVCLDVARGFMGPPGVDYPRAVTLAFRRWSDYARARGVSGLATFRVVGECPGKPGPVLKIHFGRDFPAGAALDGRRMLSHVEYSSGQAQGDIWFRAVSSEWSTPQSINWALWHMIGHVLGAGHVPSTIMDEGVEWLQLPPSLLDEKALVPRFDGDRELIHCDACSEIRDVPPGQIRALDARRFLPALQAASALRLVRATPTPPELGKGQVTWHLLADGQESIFKGVMIRAGRLAGEGVALAAFSLVPISTPGSWRDEGAGRIYVGLLKSATGESRTAVLVENLPGIGLSLHYLDESGASRELLTVPARSMPSFVRPGAGEAWFPRGRAVLRACLDFDPAEKSVSLETARQSVQAAFDAWRTYDQQRPGLSWLPARLDLSTNCDRTQTASADLIIRLGHDETDPQLPASAIGDGPPIGLAVRDLRMIWVRRLIDWHMPGGNVNRALYTALLHEFGHVLGVPHLSGTVMAAEPTVLWGTGELVTAQDPFDDIDGLREVVGSLDRAADSPFAPPGRTLSWAATPSERIYGDDDGTPARGRPPGILPSNVLLSIEVLRALKLTPVLDFAVGSPESLNGQGGSQEPRRAGRPEIWTDGRILVLSGIGPAPRSVFEVIQDETTTRLSELGYYRAR